MWAPNKEIQDSLLPSTYNLSTLSNALLNHLAHGSTTDQVNDLLSDYFTITFF